MVLVRMALLKLHNSADRDTKEEEDDIYTKIHYVTRAISPFLLPMITALGDELELVEPAERYEDD